MEKLNAKYNLDCFSESELDSELDEGEQYKYEHGYETLINIFSLAMLQITIFLMYLSACMSF